MGAGPVRKEDKKYINFKNQLKNMYIYTKNKNI